MPKCDFNIFECSPVKLLHMFSATFSKKTYKGLFLLYALQSQALGQQVTSLIFVLFCLVWQNEKRCFLEKDSASLISSLYNICYVH